MSENFVYLGDGERLDTFLSKNIHQFTRSYIKKLIDEGKILVEGKKVKAGYELKNGTDISVDYVTPSEPSAKPENIDIDIVYEDDDLAVINKPYGMVVHPCTTTPEHTLVNALLYKMKSLSGVNGVLRPGIVHRLDKDTSGLLCVAKNDKSHRFLSAQLADKTMYREYYAICNGVIKQNEIDIVGNIARSKRDRKKMDVVPDGEGRYAETHLTVLKRFLRHTLIKLQLKTGRTHQIRVHTEHIGHSLMGDKIYGVKSDKTDKLMLVSKKLSFIHPTTRERVTFEIDLPDYFTNMVEKLERECK